MEQVLFSITGDFHIVAVLCAKKCLQVVDLTTRMNA